MKPLKISWSYAALDSVKADFPNVQKRVLEEVDDVIRQARSWFVHTVFLENGTDLLCNGEETDGNWQVSVQLGEFKNSQNETIGFPRPVEISDNEFFLTSDEIALRLKPN